MTRSPTAQRPALEVLQDRRGDRVDRPGQAGRRVGEVGVAHDDDRHGALGRPLRDRAGKRQRVVDHDDRRRELLEGRDQAAAAEGDAVAPAARRGPGAHAVDPRWCKVRGHPGRAGHHQRMRGPSVCGVGGLRVQIRADTA